MLEIPGDGEVSDDENVAHEEDGQLIEERTHSSDPEDSSDSDYENIKYVLPALGERVMCPLLRNKSHH